MSDEAWVGTDNWLVKALQTAHAERDALRAENDRLREQIAAAQAEQERLRAVRTETERLVHDAGKFIECWTATRDDKHATIVVSRRLLRNFLASHEALRAALTANPAPIEDPLHESAPERFAAKGLQSPAREEGATAPDPYAINEEAKARDRERLKASGVVPIVMPKEEQG